jgi:hypothetical protein
MAIFKEYINTLANSNINIKYTFAKNPRPHRINKAIGTSLTQINKNEYNVSNIHFIEDLSND